MSIDYSNENREKAYLLSTVGRLESEFNQVTERITNFKGQLSTIQDDQIQTDLKSVEAAAERFNKIVSSCYEPEEQSRLLDDAHLREIRHDMRAAVGAVMGYVELIQEALEDIKSPPELSQIATSLHKTASGILLTIEAFIVGKVLAEIDEGDDLFDYLQDLITGNILIVDDCPQKRELFSRKLKKMGHNIVAVEGGNQALEYLKKNDVDIILLDLFMPGMNGDEMLQKLKSDERLKAIPVLVVSSSSDMDNIIKCIRLGADDYLPMPVNNTLLHARINACLTRKISRDRELKTLDDLSEARQRLSTAIDNIDEGFAVFNSDDILVTCNNRFTELYPSVKSLGGIGFSYEDLVRENIKLGVYQPERRNVSSGDEGSLNEKEIEDWVSLKVGYHQNPTRAHIDLLASGTWIEVIENKIPGRGIVSVHKDISEGKKKEKRLEYLALHDGLTGLANRKNFDDALQALVEDSQKEELKFGVVFFDLDGFKNVNDTLGHEFGDFLLQTVAMALTENVRETDLIARFGGDEFAALIIDINSQEEMVQVAERCLKAVGTEVEKDG